MRVSACVFFGVASLLDWQNGALAIANPSGEETVEKVADSEQKFVLKPDASLLDYLDPSLFEDPSVLKEIKETLRRGSLVAIKDAFIPEFAEYAWSSFSRDDLEWEPFVSIKPNGHNFLKHRPVSKDKEEVFKQVSDVFKHKESRKFMSSLSGRNCHSSNISTLLSWYKPGDHSNPHSDRLGKRTVTFLWQLSKDWDPAWGGAFYWNNAFFQNAYQHASFNTLLLFPVTATSTHAVTPVLPASEGYKRLTFCGWYNAKITRDEWDTVHDPLELMYATPEDRSDLTYEEAKRIVAMDLSEVKDEARRQKLDALKDDILDEAIHPLYEDAIYVLGFPEENHDLEKKDGLSEGQQERTS